MPARWMLHLAAIGLMTFPALQIGFGLTRGSVGPDPVEALMLESGIWTLRLLLLTLAMTPLQRWTHWRWPIVIRRDLGLGAFAYGLAHLLVFVIFDQNLELTAAWREVIEHPAVWLGMLALMLMLPLAITSTQGWITRLGAHWKRLHRLIYPAAILAVLHFAFQVKSDLREPIIHAALLAALFILRLPRPPQRNRGTPTPNHTTIS
ncbi:MAG: ferric reductase-like transmembrane domain-containing protein [Pseudomonadota bacterium]|nr:ferric reductase-like transmembrane domain-containing protein [Pseudomonadota bacterium]